MDGAAHVSEMNMSKLGKAAEVVLSYQADRQKYLWVGQTR